MKRVAEDLIKRGGNKEFIWQAYNQVRDEIKATKQASRQGKRDEKVKNEISHSFDTRCETIKIRLWYQQKLLTKKNIKCEVERCEAIAVRKVTVKYEDSELIRNICLRHFNGAHKVLTAMPAC